MSLSNIPNVWVGANCIKLISTGIRKAEGTNEGSTALMHYTWQL